MPGTSATKRSHDSEPRLRALAFWVGHHQAAEPAPRIGPSLDTDRDARDAMRARRLGELALMVPELKCLAGDSRPSVRATAARCFAILATAGLAPSDREVWRLLLGLAKYDHDADVKRAADAALAALERHGAIATRRAG